MLRFSLISHITVFIFFHLYGTVNQILRLYNESGQGKLSSVLNFSDFFSSPIPVYLAQYIIVTLLLTYLFIVSQSRFALTFSRLIKSHVENPKIAILIWTIICNSSLFIINAAWFNHSVHLTNRFHTWPAIHLSTYLCLIALVLPLILMVVTTLKHKVTQVFIASSAILFILFEITSFKNTSIEEIKDLEKPHVIFIGIDSLRNDLLLSHMPFLSSQLKDAVLFDNTFTPLGRTYPAWNSILTGLYPVNHGARINLVDSKNLVSSSHYLGSVLKGNGYKTIFAMDETRFANMSTHHGFDSIISPRIGASDFIVGTIADFPLTNLLSLLPISSWILPEVYGNRGVAATYRAEAFNELLARHIPPATEPTFLSIHFCLAHWPYFFASNEFQPDWSYPEPYYPANLQAVDLQLERLIKDLDKKGYLKNSKIVFLSDHGEAWLQEADIFKNENIKSIDEQEYARSAEGHGSSLLNNSNRVLMAFKGFDSPGLHKNTSKMASLADLKPTILDELNIAIDQPMDGRSLLAPDLEWQFKMPIETGTILTTDNDKNLNIDDLVNKHLHRYQLNPNGLISVREDKLELALQLKEVGILNGNKILTKQNGNFYRLFDLHEKTFKSYPTLLELSRSQPLWAESLCKWYGKEDEHCSTILPLLPINDSK